MVDLITYLLICSTPVVIVLIATYFINRPTFDYEKHSSYGCGLGLFGDAREPFGMHFYTAGILFIVLDSEVVYLTLFAIDVRNLSPKRYCHKINFIFIILMGFYYEWITGLLDWLSEKATLRSVKVRLMVKFIWLQSMFSELSRFSLDIMPNTNNPFLVYTDEFILILMCFGAGFVSTLSGVDLLNKLRNLGLYTVSMGILTLSTALQLGYISVFSVSKPDVLKNYQPATYGNRKGGISRTMITECGMKKLK